MKLARVWILGGVVLAGGVARLLADPIPDPTMTFTVPGHHSFDLSNCDGDFPCTFTAGVVGPDGFATDGLDIKNDTPFVVNELKFFIPTENFDQLFNAHTNTFTNAAISFDFEEGLTIVDYFGIGETQVDGGSASRFGCSDCEPGAPGFLRQAEPSWERPSLLMIPLPRCFLD
jgi:hypothetical protein